MDSHHHQWRHQEQSDQLQHQPSANLPKLDLHVDQQQQQQQSPASAAAFPNAPPFACPRVGGYFSLAQWQELELQALIYKYILAGAAVPWELILPIKRSLLNASPYYLCQHLQPSVMQTRSWGRGAVDPEPGRCRRTDGKKWRCSREAVTGRKYCERHVHRGRSRSRKHVEIPTPVEVSGLKTSVPSPLAASKETHFTPSGCSPTLNMLPLNQRTPESRILDDGFPVSYCYGFPSKEVVEGTKSDGHVLWKFFDDWPRSKPESNTATNIDTTPAVSTTHLSITIPENSPSDFSLKLATGNWDKSGPISDKGTGYGQVQQPPANWSGWLDHVEASMGGPLAEALRSSSSTPSPTSVLHKPNGLMSETSSIST